MASVTSTGTPRFTVPKPNGNGQTAPNPVPKTVEEVFAAQAAGRITAPEAIALVQKLAAGQPTTAPQAVPLSALEAVGALQPKTFSSGSRGYWAGGKVLINGERCQVTITATVIGSKPKVAE